MTYLNENKLREQNSKYEGIQFKELNESKTILGYDCKKLIAQLKDGSYFTLFYTSSIIASNKIF
jgi:GLPGLI family protein